ncbi:MAG: hypothetical protein ACFBSE_08780 [Prochloraceae cyanobacterium]
MQKLGTLGTSVLVTVGLIVYLEAFPINANNYPQDKEIEKIEEEKVANYTIKQLIKNRILNRFRLRDDCQLFL